MKFFFLTYIESSIPAPYSKEYSRHIVLLDKQKQKLIFWNFETRLTTLRRNVIVKLPKKSLHFAFSKSFAAKKFDFQLIFLYLFLDNNYWI